MSAGRAPGPAEIRPSRRRIPTQTPEYQGEEGDPTGGWLVPDRVWLGGAAEGWTPVREMRVMAVGVEAGARRPVLLLQEASGNHRLLPVWIGMAEANAITVEQQRVSLPRPMTHQLIGDVIDAFGRHVEQVRITEVRDNIFYAELILDRDTRVSARVSDAIALALHLGIPIHAEDTVLDAAAVANTAIRTEGDDRTPDDVEEFRRFLDTTSPEDFDPD